jgi:hypothetical protein
MHGEFVRLLIEEITAKPDNAYNSQSINEICRAISSSEISQRGFIESVS